MARILQNPRDRKVNHSFSCETKIIQEFDEKSLFKESKTRSNKLRELIIIYLGQEEQYGLKIKKK